MSWWKKAKKASEVWLSGKLKNQDGFIYLDVPNAIITPFRTLLPDTAHPRETVDSDITYVGAHISVMFPDELENVKIKELGDDFSYRIKGLETVEPEGKDAVYFVTVDSPELEKLREKYNLSKRIKDHDFHITVGVDK